MEGGAGMKESGFLSLVSSSCQNLKRYNHPDKKGVSGFHGNAEAERQRTARGGKKGVKFITTVSF